MFSTVLIANRGEIALRVARTCRELGIRTVAVYSTADRDSAVVRFADETVHIGPTSAAAQLPERGGDHRGGAADRRGGRAPRLRVPLRGSRLFAEACDAHGLRFIGPSASVLERLGDKARARAVLAATGLPVLPGTNRALHSVAEVSRPPTRSATRS